MSVIFITFVAKRWAREEATELPLFAFIPIIYEMRYDR